MRLCLAILQLPKPTLRNFGGSVHSDGWQVLPVTCAVQQVLKPDVGGSPNVPASDQQAVAACSGA
jgi:hypothetical protein